MLAMGLPAPTGPIVVNITRSAAARGIAYLLFVYTEDAVAFILVAAARDGLAILAIAITADPG
jgi:hypothetical protein